MLPTGPRTIDSFRRITIPAKVAKASGVRQPSWVRIGVVADQRIVEIVPTRGPRGTKPSVRGNPDRPRRLRTSRQIALPAAVLESAGLDIGSVVAFLALEDRIHLFAASRVIAPEPTPVVTVRKNDR
ncbi:hypothetical protein ABLE94_13350 [Gordonia sp. VNK1]|uniref:hypothetical protein n=1 Tax=Gordonia oleivorans TaxID=3156618 RepID=UPI0032B46BE3